MLPVLSGMFSFIFKHLIQFYLLTCFNIWTHEQVEELVTVEDEHTKTQEESEAISVILSLQYSLRLFVIL